MASTSALGHFEPRGRSLPGSGRESSDDMTPADSLNHTNSDSYKRLRR